jgi:hypothetical protein
MKETVHSKSPGQHSLPADTPTTGVNKQRKTTRRPVLFAIRDEINADDERQRALDWPCEQNDTRAPDPSCTLKLWRSK